VTLNRLQNVTTGPELRDLLEHACQAANTSTNHSLIMALPRGMDSFHRRIANWSDEKGKSNSVIFIQFKDLIS
jgi:hypothetical protein